jgi:hypothetical protein
MEQSNFIGNMFTTYKMEFDENEIQFDTLSNIYKHFGILNLNAFQVGHNNLSHEFIFMVDRSSSMEEKCGDGKTKMQHICHILKNMVAYFNENQTIDAHITICTFDDNAKTIIERTKVTDINFNKIINTIDNILPRASTDIELALKHINICCSTIRSNFPRHNICSVFMTDGQISKGSSDIDTISGLIDRTIDNAFIGVGLDHDGALLTTLGSGKNCNYYFIDKLENSGFVYGEIIHGIIYKILHNVYITIDNGLIYDFKNNVWVNTIEIGNIVGDSNKTYHIASFNPDLCYATVSGNSLDGIAMDSITIIKEDGFIDLEKYMYRQRTLQHLYNITEFSKRQSHKDRNNIFNFIEKSDKQSILEEQTNISNTLKSFMKEMKNYINENNLHDDSFMKNLCDDIYICYRTFTTKYATMYASARQTSQGTQRCYTVNNTPDDYITKIPRLMRETHRFHRPSMLNRSYSSDFISPDSNTPDNISPDSNTLNIITQDENDSISHVVYSFDDTQSPYRTPSSVTLMRAISNTPKRNCFDDTNSDQESSPSV